MPGGSYYRSYDAAPDLLFGDMSAPATVSTFSLDKYEVTVGRFRQFVRAGMATRATPPAAGAGGRTLNGIANQGGWDPTWNTDLAADTTALIAAFQCDPQYVTWTDVPGANESRPMNCITWYEALAFCAWDRGSLPSEAEWNYAAAGGSLQRAYPWSSPPESTTIDCTRATYGGASWPTTACADGTNDVGTSSPIGDGRWGHVDLSGNAWEWLEDLYAIAYPTPCADCANLSAGTTRVIRGGSFTDNPRTQRSAHRDHIPALERHYNVGVRCARAS